MDLQVGDDVEFHSPEHGSLRGTVRKIEDYGETTVVEHVVTVHFNRYDLHEGPNYIPWKGYYIEEPAGEWRLNVVETDGSRTRTIHWGPMDSEQVSLR